jgi:hypothetical protein
MYKYYLFFIIIFITVVCSCKKKQSPLEIEKAKSFQKADSTARAFLDSISVPTKVNGNIWQLDEFEFFGYAKLFSETLGNKFDLVDSISPYDSITKITYKTWIEGVDKSFRYVKQIRKMLVTLNEKNNIYKVVDFSFPEIKSLPFGRQFLYFSLATIFLFALILFFPGNPAIGLLICTWIIGKFPEEAQPGCLTILLTIIFDIIACYTIYIFFNSIGAVLLGLIPCTIFIMIVVGLIIKKTK